jgi:F5/8 type C domain
LSPNETKKRALAQKEMSRFGGLQRLVAMAAKSTGTVLGLGLGTVFLFGCTINISETPKTGADSGIILGPDSGSSMTGGGAASSGGGTAAGDGGTALSVAYAYTIFESPRSGSGELAFIHDGDLNSSWTSRANQSKDLFFRLDLGAVRAFSTISIQSGDSANYLRSYEIYASDAANTWGTWIAAGDASLSPAVIKLTPTNARYLTMRLGGAKPGLPWTISELEVTSDKPTEPDTCAPGDVIGPNGTYIPPVYSVRCGTRDAFAWPYSKNSPWNMPIGNAATYVPAGITPAIKRFGDYKDGDMIFGVDPNFNVPAAASDPLTTVYRGNYHTCTTDRLATEYFGGPTPFQIRVPQNFISLPFDKYLAADANLSSAYIQPDGTVVQLNYTGRCTAGGPLIGVPVWEFMAAHRTRAEIEADQKLKVGLGIYGGHGGSAMSAHGGNLRKGDLLGPTPIQHVLSMDIWGLFLFYESICQDPYGTCRGYRWPAATNDGAAPVGISDPVGGYYGTNREFRMGALLALLPSLTEAALQLRTPEARKLFHALQDYGVYVVDDTGWKRTDFNMDVEAAEEYQAARGFYFGSANQAFGAESPSQLDLFHDLRELVTALHVVSNNGPTSVGGGGTPRQPLAPDFRR